MSYLTKLEVVSLTHGWSCGMCKWVALAIGCDQRVGPPCKLISSRSHWPLLKMHIFVLVPPPPTRSANMAGCVEMEPSVISQASWPFHFLLQKKKKLALYIFLDSDLLKVNVVCVVAPDLSTPVKFVSFSGAVNQDQQRSASCQCCAQAKFPCTISQHVGSLAWNQFYTWVMFKPHTC